MTLKRYLPLLAILAFTNSAFAQHHPANHGGGHPGVAAPHPAMQHPNQHLQQHHITPEMQMWNDQWMFEQIMRSRSGGTRHGAHNQNGNLQRQSGGKQNHPGMNQQSPNSAGSSSASKQHSNEEREKKAKENKAANKKGGKHQEEHPSHHQGPHKALATNNRPLRADQATISLLKTAQMKLSKADHDYAGHRVQAMRHVARALEHLSGSYLFNEDAAFGAGNLPQSQSDLMLREAEGHLKYIENSLRTWTNTLEHHQSARTSVAEAIHELRTALAIR